jgi:hypothetical protein
MNKVLAPPDVAVATQQQTTTEPAPSQDVVVKPQTPTTVDAPPATVEQQRALAETKKELARLRGEMATVKEELKSTQRSSPAVDLNKVTIAAPNEAAPITPPEPPDAAATPTKAASVAGSEAPTDKTVVKPAEPPGGLTSPPPGPVVGKSDSITIGTSAAKESGTPTAAAGSPEADASNGTPTGTKTDSPDFVRSPFPPHNKLDVKGMRPGSLAKDPTNGKVFRVP